MSNQTKVLPCWLDEAELDGLQDDPAWQGLSGNHVGADCRELLQQESPHQLWQKICSTTKTVGAREGSYSTCTTPPN